MATQKPMTGMLNDEGKCVDLYIPRKCDYTNKILPSRDFSSVQINVAEVDDKGRYANKFDTVVLSGFLRQKGQSAAALEAVLKQRGVLPIQQL